MKTSPPRKKGFTLVEMTVVIVFGMALSSAGMLLLNQQIQTIQRLNAQDFILREAPQINTTLTALLSRADAIRLHDNFNDAVLDQNPVLADGKVLIAAFRNIDNTTTFGIISFETVAGTDRLNYYFYDPSSTPPTQGSPSWTVSRDIGLASFNLVDGLFQAALTGPGGEQLTYTVSPNQ